MKRFATMLCLAAMVFLMAAGSARAEKSRPIQIALINPVQIFNEGDAVMGVRLNLIYGRNTTVKGIDWGLINHTTSGLSKAWQAGLVGVVDEDFLGFQDNWFNVVKGDCEGFQAGIYNHANAMHGLQLGLINYAKTTYGLQIGLVNIIGQNGAFPVFPIVNWSF